MDLSLERLDDIPEPERKDPFFDPAAIIFVDAIASLARISKYPDLLTCKVILDLENLAERLEVANLDEAVKLPFTHFITTKGTLTGTAIQMSARTLVQRILPTDADVGAVELLQRCFELERLLKSPSTGG